MNPLFAIYIGIDVQTSFMPFSCFELIGGCINACFQIKRIRFGFKYSLSS
jgi:hypothetical protein